MAGTAATGVWVEPCPAAPALLFADSETVLVPELFFAAVFFALFFDELVFGPVKEFLQYAGIQTLLHFALLIIVMCIAIVLRNNVISMMLSVCLCMNVLVIFYSFLDNLIAKAHIKNFHVLEYTVTGNISFLETNVTAKMAVTALAVSIAFVIVMIEVCSTVFKKRDI